MSGVSGMSGQQQVPTTERLALALEAAGAPPYMVQRARQGYYDDYKSPLAGPIMQLVADATAERLPEIATRAADGEFDGTREEADEWARSAEGQETFRKFFGHGPTDNGQGE